jgi:anti-sigma B factor antagonist
MMMATLQTAESNATTEHGQPVCWVNLGTTLNNTTLNTLLQEQLGQGHKHFVLECSELSFVDSSGLGALVSQYKAVKAQEGNLVLYRITPFVQKLVALTRLDRILPIAHGESTLHALLNPPPPEPVNNDNY